MDNKAEDQDKPVMRVKTLRCRRTGQMFQVSVHARCPYCFADDDTIAKGGQYERFCDYDPEKDPINFGFPPDSTRTQSG